MGRPSFSTSGDPNGSIQVIEQECQSQPGGEGQQDAQRQVQLLHLAGRPAMPTTGGVDQADIRLVCAELTEEIRRAICQGRADSVRDGSQFSLVGPVDVDGQDTVQLARLRAGADRTGGHRNPLIGQPLTDRACKCLAAHDFTHVVHQIL